MAAALERRRARLHGDLSDVACVRRSIGDWLRDWDLGPLVEDVELVASELVTNAILHAGGEIDVVLERRGEGVRVLVRDGCPDVVPAPSVLPSLDLHDADVDDDLGRLARSMLETSTTGRGLLLVEAFSDAWGADVAPTSKEVWAELGTGRSAGSGHVHEPAGAGQGDPVHLWDVPVRLVLLSAGNMDDLVRELQTTDFSSAAPSELAGLGERLVQQTSSSREPLRVAARAALERHARRIDVHLDVPRGQVDALRHFIDMTGPVQQLCQAGLLLSEPPGDELTAFRRWFVDEVARQLHGVAPSRCPFPE
jgi:anti-sigma regulatory factor (Ser/Thr protein kinase)